MKIAMFSPLPPQKTGVALYTKNLILSLKNRVDIDLFTDAFSCNEFQSLKVYDYVSHPHLISKLDQYDLIVYHVGNNWHFHLNIYNLLSFKQGLVVLHDAVLYYLIAGQDEYSFTRDFLINYGWQRQHEIREILQKCKNNNFLTYPFPERYPLLKTVLDNANAIVVHSKMAKNIVLSHGYDKDIFEIPFLIYQDALEKKLNVTKRKEFFEKFDLAECELIISTLGFISSTKRLTSIFSALREIKKSVNFKFLIVGEGCDLSLPEQIKKYDLQDHVCLIGYLTADDDFFEIMLLSDIIINLRYPSMGETSSIVIQSMYFSKPCIVTDFGWFAELPDNAVYKIPHDEREIASLTEGILNLHNNKEIRLQIGKNAKQFVVENCLPESVCARYQAAFLSTLKMD